MVEKAKENEVVILEKEDYSSNKKLSHKEKRYERIRNRFFKENDIKYEGPLSYRALRVLEWICMALGQVTLLNSIGIQLFHYNQLGATWSQVISIFAALSTPFFIIASFGMVLSGRRDMRDFMLIYGVAYLGVGLGFIFFYLRYINGLFVKMGLNQTPFPALVAGFLSDKVQVNVFADLFAFALFHFFISYTPKRVFKDKLLIIFRLFCLVPIALVITSYILKILSATKMVDLPFYIFPFLTTKSPVVYFVFVTMSLWIKYRERWFLRLGATKEEFHRFLNTKRNSLSVSIHLSIIILISLIFDVFLFIFAVIYFFINNVPLENILEVTTNTFGVGQSVSMILAIPFILLYSYQRKHKDTRIDIAIPVVGIALIVVVYVEGIYQFILNILGLH